MVGSYVRTVSIEIYDLTSRRLARCSIAWRVGIVPTGRPIAIRSIGCGSGRCRAVVASAIHSAIHSSMNACYAPWCEWSPNSRFCAIERYEERFGWRVMKRERSRRQKRRAHDQSKNFGFPCHVLISVLTFINTQQDRIPVVEPNQSGLIHTVRCDAGLVSYQR
jgi:hypothetical protein